MRAMEGLWKPHGSLASPMEVLSLLTIAQSGLCGVVSDISTAAPFWVQAIVSEVGMQQGIVYFEVAVCMECRRLRFDLFLITPL